MSEIGIFYGSTTGNTEVVARAIQREWGDGAVLFNVAQADPAETDACTALICGTPTWGIGDLQDNWLTFLPELLKRDLKDKPVALFGLGDQESYADSFCDGMGKLYQALKPTGIVLSGAWSAEGYTFESSESLVDDRFVGLVLDADNQAPLMEKRIKQWVGQLRESW